MELRPRRLREQPARGRGPPRRRRRRPRWTPPRSSPTRHGDGPRRSSALRRTARRACSARPPDGESAMIESTRRGRRDHRGRRRRVHPATRAPAPPSAAAGASARRRATAIHLDPETGELAAPLGTIDHLARAHARAGRRPSAGSRSRPPSSPTDDPNLPITFAAREGERVVLQRRRRPVRAVTLRSRAVSARLGRFRSAHRAQCASGCARRRRTPSGSPPRRRPSHGPTRTFRR